MPEGNRYPLLVFLAGDLMLPAIFGWIDVVGGA